MPDPHAPRTKEELIRDFRTSEILEAARRVIETLGLPEASMERIAHEAGVAKGTIYLYFKNKEELLLKVVQEAFDRMIAGARNSTKNAEGATQKLAALIQDSLAHVSQLHAFFRAVNERAVVGAAGASQLDDEYDREVAEYIDLVAAIIDEGVATGELRPCSSQRVALLLTESLRGLIRQRVREEPPPAEADTELMIDVFLRGIAAGGNA